MPSTEKTNGEDAEVGLRVGRGNVNELRFRSVEVEKAVGYLEATGCDCATQAGGFCLKDSAGSHEPKDGSQTRVCEGLTQKERVMRVQEGTEEGIPCELSK